MKKRRKYWYQFWLGECPVCGRDMSYKERVYLKPKNKYRYLTTGSCYEEFGVGWMMHDSRCRCLGQRSLALSQALSATKEQQVVESGLMETRTVAAPTKSAGPPGYCKTRVKSLKATSSTVPQTCEQARTVSRSQL